MSSSTTMSSPRLVREICRKYPASTAYVGGVPVYQSYVYEAPSTEVVAGTIWPIQSVWPSVLFLSKIHFSGANSGGQNGGVQLLRYVRVSSQPDGQQRIGSFRRPRSEMVMPRKFDLATQQNRDHQLDASAAVTPTSPAEAAAAARYGSQDLGTDDMAVMTTSPSSNAAEVISAGSPSPDGGRTSSVCYSPLVVVVTLPGRLLLFNGPF